MVRDLGVPTPGQILLQRCAAMVVKAGLTSIPLAALAWDMMAGGLEFANDRMAESFLHELADRVEKLEGHDGTLHGPAQAAAHEALQRLVMEESEDFARDLAAAVAAIEGSTEDARLLRQVALAVSSLNSRMLIYLGVIHRFNIGKLTPRETALLDEVQPFPDGTFGDGDSFDALHTLQYILDRHSPSLGLDADLARMEANGLIRVPQIRHIVRTKQNATEMPVRLTSLGQIVIEAFFDDPTVVPTYSDLAA